MPPRGVASWRSRSYRSRRALAESLLEAASTTRTGMMWPESVRRQRRLRIRRDAPARNKQSLFCTITHSLTFSSSSAAYDARSFSSIVEPRRPAPPRRPLVASRLRSHLLPRLFHPHYNSASSP